MSDTDKQQIEALLDDWYPKDQGLGLLKSIADNTQPIDDHPDPGSIHDCFSELVQVLHALYDSRASILEQLKQKDEVIEAAKILCKWENEFEARIPGGLEDPIKEAVLKLEEALAKLEKCNE